eukprot:TRINITY_DN38849_c0_g1_i1.p1 TRINITY_DN38849_c0_g1~~TRINITY_DN38849_c0_g1_i1.p1  ORF type:complete len:173 (-),score=12.16 TRINITY_DN38849_c0_g1_i1:43-561(-)
MRPPVLLELLAPMDERSGVLAAEHSVGEFDQAPASSQQSTASASSTRHEQSPPSKGSSVCPICKASVTLQNVIPVYTRESHTDPRNMHPDLPSRPPGERPEPEPASVLAMQTFSNGSVAESFGYSTGQGYFPVVFGLNWQGASLFEGPATSKKTSYMLVGLSSLYFLIMFLL